MSSIYNPYHITPPSQPAPDEPPGNGLIPEGAIDFEYDSYMDKYKKMVWMEGEWVEADFPTKWYSEYEVEAFRTGKSVAQVRKEAAGGGGGDGGTSIAVANINAQQRELDRQSDERIAAIRDAREGISQDIARERLALDKAQTEDNLAEQIRHNQIIEGLYAKDRELATAQFKWQQETDTQRLSLEEQRNRIQEAGVTGYYRPSVSTSFSRPVSATAMAASAPSLAREQWQAGQAQLPGYGALSRAPVPSAIQPVAQPTAAPAPGVDTKNMNLRQLAEHFKTQQTGPPAQGTVAQAPGTKTNETQVNAEQRVVKRTVTEVFG